MPDAGFEGLLRGLELKSLADAAFRAETGAAPERGRGRLFGGLVAAQCALAASRTVPDGRHLHSLHAYFLRAGRPGPPLDLAVETLRDGGSYSARFVRARQGADIIFVASVSFCVEEEGISHQGQAPEAPPPEGLLDRDAERERLLGSRSANRGIEVRMCEPAPFAEGGSTTLVQRNWIRALGELPDDAAIHDAVMVYISDTAFMSTVNRRHPVPWPDRIAASLDHSIWIHRPPRIEGWHLFVSDSPAAHAGRGLAAGAIYDEAGQLVASVAQEAMIRRRRPNASENA
ncbi:MAG: acyl-CoA thioesterase domain-containing protein [Acidobacteriota bacterium]|nr:acyl-CoA thioesterase domain-containing protein [Acidobacteriota bacterium]